jgi:hypothetical protein
MKATYQKQALDDTALLASFFESKVAADASSAKCKLIPCK